ncbi:hypothetical protein BD309DRAFT_1028633 [Dichomitus squalens]|nr:hypothetical protein BD309DRAFT_1028633 [Dichomitus squalens]
MYSDLTLTKPSGECGPYHVAKRVGTTYTTSLNPYSKPSGAHIITFSGLTKAWPTDSDSSASSSSATAPPTPSC